jgi:hypothetical protein
MAAYQTMFQNFVKRFTETATKEGRFIAREANVVWPFLAGFGIWNYIIYTVDAGLDRMFRFFFFFFPFLFFS